MLSLLTIIISSEETECSQNGFVFIRPDDISWSEDRIMATGNILGTIKILIHASDLLA
jgi:hypothetical protein